MKVKLPSYLNCSVKMANYKQESIHNMLRPFLCTETENSVAVDTSRRHTGG